MTEQQVQKQNVVTSWKRRTARLIFLLGQKIKAPCSTILSMAEWGFIIAFGGSSYGSTGIIINCPIV